MGRPAKPNAQKSPTAKPGPELRAGAPIKPEGLSERASVEWDRLSAELEESGINVSTAHRAPLALASTIAADIRDAWEAMKKDGAYVQGKAGLQAHPATKRLDVLRRDYIKVLTLLGLRSAVSDGVPSTERTLAELLAGDD